MGIDTAIEFADRLLYEKSGRHLNDLQCVILRQAWGGQTYSTIAIAAGYSEGHVKDVASQLWRVLSEALGERITKGNCRSRLIYWLKRAKRKVVSATEKLSAATELRGLLPLDSKGGAGLPADLPPDLPADSPLDSLADSPLDSPADSMTTPLEGGTAISDPHFVGREPAIATLDALFDQGHRLIVIQGEGGIGKTTLAQRYLSSQRFDLTLDLLMAKETANITAVERVVEEWLRQDFNEEPGRDFGVTLGRLKRHLREHRIGILIDNLEPALDAHGQLVHPHRRYVELLRILADPQGRSVTLVTSRDRLCEPGFKAHHYRLPGLTLETWQQLFHSQGIAEAALQPLHQAYGGNAKAMEILLGTVLNDFDGDLALYWQINHTDPLVETDLKNLVVSQVNRLEQLDPMAYRLLCRLGCYRYQTIPKLPVEVLLAQLWEVPPAQQRQVIASLRNRSLLETYQGQYWLHPVVRAIAIARLRASADWQLANTAAARYWTDSIQQITTLAAALQALEAYYHYLELQEYGLAADVLLKSRHNQWQQFLPLASSLYRMGLLQPVVAAINQVLPKLEVSDHSRAKLSELFNLLGDVYWITGRIGNAIECQQRTISETDGALAHLQATEATRLERYYLKMLNVDSHLSIGLYRIDLGELDAARNQLFQVIKLTSNTDHAAWAEKASVALALVQAQLGEVDAARSLADQIYASFMGQGIPEHAGRFAYFFLLLGQTYHHLGELAIATKLYQQTFADANHYVQVKAKALTGLATLSRQQGQSAQALDYHRQSIDLLEAIGATCDLAEAYYQLALTHQSLPNAEWAARDYLQRAIALFRDIKAPHRITQISAQKAFLG
ncbi:MAG: NB-ARC domain-containing protein [Cyanobacteria bacterium P01_A01_bin.114]